MAQDTFVNQYQRIGTDTGGLAPGQGALIFPAALFDIIDAPDMIVTAADGGTITGATLAMPKATAPIVAASLELTGAGVALLVDNDAEIDGNIIAGGDMHVGETFSCLGTPQGGTPTAPLLKWDCTTGHEILIVGDLHEDAGANLYLVSIPSTAPASPILPSGTGKVGIFATTLITLGITAGPSITIDPTGIGEYGHATTGQGPTITQTYATTATTIPAYTANAQASAYTGAADGEAKLADLNALRAAYENLRAQSEATTQVLNRVIDYWQARGSLT